MADLPPLVAIVDDEEPVRKALSRLLGSCGMRAVAFGSGQELLDSVDIDEIACILLDIQMPGMTGLQVLEKLRARGINTPVLVMTAHEDEGLADSCISLGARCCLQKPLAARSLMEAIRATFIHRGIERTKS